MSSPHIVRILQNTRPEITIPTAVVGTVYVEIIVVRTFNLSTLP